MTHRFRFGTIMKVPLPGRTWAQSARHVEDLGFSTLVVPDHFDDQLAVGPALADAAAATTDLRLGAFVYCNDYRHPVMVAKETATLDVLSNGRVELGLGAGWKRVDYDESGMAYDRPGLRIDRMLESLEIIEGLLGDGPVDFEGEHYTIKGLEGLPKPVQSHVPLVIGGGGPRMLRIAGRHADIVGVNANLRSGEVGLETMQDVLSAERFDQKLQWVREGAGDRFDQLEINILVQSTQITSGGGATTEALEATAELFGQPPSVVAEIPLTLIGSPPEIADSLRRRRERWGFSYMVLQGGNDLDAFSAVIAELDGE
ncbi:MAG: TIGR03621 family F420-dependent LLM class oxidoreductase [Acidimicrobiaceae bacterium]|nr:TIGR03621 family F420-dependent LLM class oxidoreductase [Acidimicrobiaceae bacterium]MCY4174793.1 TIGR03621 family F420-dependent LLM class oxidoreductase [Acidimicrobiaceae bacterium]MCY4294332.1 TIGR03621 family F420-dependent LLM class oxidoreductase [Acidimicrobiaceae bacterium]